MSINSPNSELRWGILGTGWIAELFVADLQLTGHNVVAVGSRAQASADRFAGRFAIPRAHASYESLVEDPEVDVVYVATPHPRHHDDASLALRAGKHVLVEKPFTLNARQAREVVDLAAGRGLVVLEAMWTRWLPHMVEVRRLVDDGALGEVRSVLCDHTQLLPSDPGHRLNALELGGGALLDLGVYPISLASDILGNPDQVQAAATLKQTGADAETGMLLRYEGGRFASLYCASTTHGSNRAAIIGTEGSIEIDPVWCTPTSFRLLDSAGEVVSRYDSNVAGRGMQFQADEVERLIAAGELSGDILPLAETVAIMATMDQVREQIGVRYPGE
jgi:predicted dehydrogenase